MNQPSKRYGLKWTNSTLPTVREYRALSTRINEEMRQNSASPQKVVNRYRDEAFSDLDFNMAVYAYAEAFHRKVVLDAFAGRVFILRSQVEQELYAAVPWMLASVRDPNDYHFTRIRYLTECAGGWRPELEPLGRRLMAKDKRDVDVKATYAGQQLIAARFEKVGKLATKYKDPIDALRIIDGLLHDAPNALPYIKLKKTYYSNRFEFDGRRVEDAKMALQWADRYRAIAPKGSEVVGLFDRFDGPMKKAVKEAGPTATERLQ